MDSNAPGFAETTRGKAVQYSEPVFLALFCAEMAAKITATGFRGHPNAYLADNWNRMDFFVVILGVLAALDLGNFSAIRVVRVLRPLRTLQGFEGTRRLVVTLLRSMPLLFDVTVLVSFLFFTFGLVGVQLYSGAFTSRCSTLANAPADCSLCGRSDAVDAATGCDVDACAASFAAADESGWAPRWVATKPTRRAAALRARSGLSWTRIRRRGTSAPPVPTLRFATAGSRTPITASRVSTAWRRRGSRFSSASRWRGGRTSCTTRRTR